MTTPHEIEEAAKALYASDARRCHEQGPLPEWDNLPPHTQVSYIRRAEFVRTSSPVEVAS